MRRRLCLCGGLVFAGALLASAPATLADALCAAASDGRWRLAEARGTLWHGSAQPLRSGDAAALPRLAWRLDLAPLAQGAVALELTLAGSDAALHARLLATPGRLALSAGGELPAAAAAALANAPSPLPQGRLQVSGDGLVRDAAGYHGQLALTWHEARLAAAGARPLGSYRLDLDGSGESFAGRVHTVAGPLQLSGELRWTPAAAPGRRLAAEFAATPPAGDAALAALLDLAGRRDGNTHRLELRL